MTLDLAYKEQNHASRERIRALAKRLSVEKLFTLSGASFDYGLRNNHSALRSGRNQTWERAQSKRKRNHMHPEVKALIEHYHFQPLPIEGTLFVSAYRSAQEDENGKPVCTAIIAMYCDEPRSVSLFHKLKYDEVWHFYGGDLLRLVLLYPDGASKDVIM